MRSPASRFPVSALFAALLTLSGCASGPPTLEQGRVKEKLDLRLTEAFFGEEGMIELGSFIRVVVRTREIITPAVEETLSVYGELIQAMNRFVTVTTTPDRIPWIAALKQVEAIELDLADAAPPRRPLRPLPRPEQSTTIPPR